MKSLEGYTIKDNVTYRKDKSIKMALLEDLRTVCVLQVDSKINCRKN